MHSKHERIDNHDDDDLGMVQLKNVEVENWLKEKCNLMQYLDNFVENGYDSIEMIPKIDNIEELEEIGITLKGHQKMILSEIMKLKQSEGQNEADGQLGTLKS